MRKKKKRNKEQIFEDVGEKNCFCPVCDYSFSVSWQLIFDLQECTHGYVGYEYFHEEFIPCPQCGKNVNCYDELYSIIENLKDEELPF